MPDLSAIDAAWAAIPPPTHVEPRHYDDFDPPADLWLASVGVHVPDDRDGWEDRELRRRVRGVA